MLGVLTDPDAFFADRVDQASLVRPALVVLLVAVLGAIQATLMVQKMMSALPESAAAAGTIAIVFAVVGGLVAPFFFWVLFTAVFYVLSLAFDPDGEFTTLLSFTGYGYLPAVFNVVISGVITYFLITQMPVPTDLQAFAQYQQQLQSAALYQASVLIGLVFTLWRAFIWTFAVKHARDLTLKQSGIVVGIPVAISVIYTVVTTFA